MKNKYSYFLVENYFKIPSGFTIVDKFNTVEEAIARADEEHGLSRGLDPIKWEGHWWDGKQLSNVFNSVESIYNDWRYEIHRNWE